MPDPSIATGATPTTGAEVLVDVLTRRGVPHVFGLCGHTIVAVLAALGRSDIRFVAVHHEQMAAHAADAYARLSGRAGVVLVHLGPGLTNTITGVANASLDSVPMVVIAGNVQSYFFGRHAHMETTLHGDADQARALAPFCKRIWRVEQPGALVPALDAAFAVAESGRPGPVLVDVAMDVFSRHVALPPSWQPAVTPPRAAPDPDVVAAAADLLTRSRFPVVYVGGGVIRSRGTDALRRVVDALGAPLAYSIMGAGSIPDAHPLVVGMSGFWGTPAANSACLRADTILAVGTDFGELDASSWQPGKTFNFPPTKLIHVHDDPGELGRSYRPEVAVTADARLFLEALASALGERHGAGVLPDDLRELKDQFDQAQEVHRRSDAFPLRPERVLADLRTALPEDGVVVADTGWNKNGVGQQFPLYRPGTLLAPGGFATMGFGPSAALGAVLAAPDRPVVALVGDGAFLTNLSVIQTAVEESLPVVWAVMNNGTYATISGLQQRHFGSEYGASFDSSRTDYASVARALGAQGTRVTSADELVAVLKEAIGSGVPYVVDIPTTRDPVPTTGEWDIRGLFEGARQGNGGARVDTGHSD